MTKAEQAALNAYDTNTPATIRIAYRDGYEQCEKDLAITIEAARALVESVEKYIRQEELRSQLLIKKENLKKLL